MGVALHSLSCLFSYCCLVFLLWYEAISKSNDIHRFTRHLIILFLCSVESRISLSASISSTLVLSTLHSFIKIIFTQLINNKVKYISNIYNNQSILLSYSPSYCHY